MCLPSLASDQTTPTNGDKMSIQSQWDEFRGLFLPPNAPDIQVRQLKNAFFAGSASTLREITGDDPEKPPGRQAMIKVVAETYVELSAFAMEAKFQ
jgi:hypothetical protein